MQPSFKQMVEQIKELPLSQKQILRKILDEQIASSNNENPIDLKRQKRLAWIKTNRAQFGGMYVALDGDNLLGAGKNYAEAFEAAKRAGVKDAFVDFIAPTDYVGEIGGWE